MTNLLDKTLRNRYHVQEFMGRGGMAEVYKVWDQHRMVHLAAKVLHEDLAIDKIFLRRFEREAKNLAKLQHPNIVRFYGFENEDRVAFILMDFIEGETLKHVIYDAKGPIPLGSVIRVVRSICSALQFAHDEGVVHCDIKPANIMFDQSGNLLLTDFGIARMTDGATATMVGTGTPAYMAPEQIRGENPSPRSDLYSFGIVLYEMLTGGERPFTGEKRTTGSTSEKVRWEQLHTTPPSPKKWNPQISDELEAVVMRCLEKEPDKRFSSALDMWNAFEMAVGVETVTDSIISEKHRDDLPRQDNEKKPLVSKPAPNQKTGDKARSSLAQAVLIGVVVPLAILLIWGISGGFTFGLPVREEPPPGAETQEYSSMILEDPGVDPGPEGDFEPTLIGGGSGQLAYIGVTESNTLGIYLLDLSTRQKTVITEGDGMIMSFAWSPDGTQIVYSMDTGGPYNLYMINADGSGKWLLTSDGEDPTWSSSLNLIAFTRDGDIYTIRPDGGGEALLLESHDGSYRSPHWSPDGTKLAYAHFIGYTNIIEVYTMELGEIEIVLDFIGAWYPVWSPNGQYFTFNSGFGDAASDRLYRMDADGGNINKLSTDNYIWSRAGWSPDSTLIAASTGSVPFLGQIVLYDLEGNIVDQLTDAAQGNYHPAWRP